MGQFYYKITIVVKFNYKQYFTQVKIFLFTLTKYFK